MVVVVKNNWSKYRKDLEDMKMGGMDVVKGMMGGDSDGGGGEWEMEVWGGGEEVVEEGSEYVLKWVREEMGGLGEEE